MKDKLPSQLSKDDPDWHWKSTTKNHVTWTSTIDTTLAKKVIYTWVSVPSSALTEDHGWGG